MKRARGLHNRRNIKWQDRLCRLTNVSLDYYDPKKLVSQNDAWREREREREKLT